MSGAIRVQRALFMLLAATLVPAGTCFAEAAGERRQPQVAGQFYPADPGELKQAVTKLLGQAPAQAPASKPRILIVPHAGYPYSGSVAAAGFRHVQGAAYDAVVVVGFTHRLRFPGASVDAAPGYLTPLGEIPIHEKAAAALQHHPGIAYNEAAHASGEHSLEVELPFLQVALGDFRLVPVLLGSDRLEDARRLAEALADLAQTGDYLFVFSTDLSHYHEYEEAMARDQRTVNAILFETGLAVDRLFSSGVLEACGRGPIVTSLLLAAKLGYPRRTLLAYANSGDTAGDHSRVVGYASIGMVEEPRAADRPALSKEAGDALVRAARLVLDMRLRPSKYQNRIVPLGLDALPELAQPRGVFVTLRKGTALRGCIGRIETDEPLRQSLPVVALEAAFDDPRFPPVTTEELDGLHIEVSVLTPPTALADLKELVPGRDGVILRHQGRGGVFLPQVWEETGWTRVEFLRELASQKAGLPADAWKEAALSTFQDEIFEEPSR